VKGERVRNSAKTVLHTLYLLKQLPSLDSLPVNDLIYILGKSPMDFFSVADPDPRSRAFFEPLDPGWVKIRIRIRDEQLGSYFRQLRNHFLS
jgi:hypothetical protein